MLEVLLPLTILAILVFSERKTESPIKNAGGGSKSDEKAGDASLAEKETDPEHRYSTDSWNVDEGMSIDTTDDDESSLGLEDALGDDFFAPLRPEDGDDDDDAGIEDFGGGVEGIRLVTGLVRRYHQRRRHQHHQRA